MPIRQFHWQREVTISSSLNVAGHLSDNARPNTRRLNVKGSFLDHVTHASSLSNSWRFSHVGHQPAPIRLSHWRSDALAMLSRETGQVVRRALRAPVDFDRGEDVLMYFEGIVAWGRCTLLTVMCSSICCHLSTCPASSFSTSLKTNFGQLVHRVFAYLQEPPPYFPARAHCWPWWQHPGSSCSTQKATLLRHEHHAWVRGAPILHRDRTRHIFCFGLVAAKGTMNARCCRFAPDAFVPFIFRQVPHEVNLSSEAGITLSCLLKWRRPSCPRDRIPAKHGSRWSIVRALLSPDCLSNSHQMSH